MAAFVNLSFETQGATPGLADGWTLTQSVSWPMAGFTGAAVDGPESFEAGWGADPWETTVDSPVGAVFGVGVVYPTGAAYESFEAAGDGGWDTGYQTQLGSVVGAEFGTGLDDYEGFETEWAPNQAFLTQFVGIGTDLEAAVFDAGGSANPFESFEFDDGWDTAYKFVSGLIITAQFGTSAGPVGYEGFESVRFQQAVSVLPSTDLIAAPAHGYSSNERLTLDTTGRLPAGLATGILYYAILPLADPTNTLKVTWESGGTAIDITDPGIGTHFVVADHTRFWTEEL